MQGVPRESSAILSHVPSTPRNLAQECAATGKQAYDLLQLVRRQSENAYLRSIFRSVASTDPALQKTRTEADEARLKECREALWRRLEALCRLSQTPGTVEEARDVERALQVRHRVCAVARTHTRNARTNATHSTHSSHPNYGDLKSRLATLLATHISSG